MFARDELRNYLLGPTLEHAVQAPYWREALGETWREVKTVADLAKLPILTKDIARRAQTRMRIGPSSFDIGAVSSGTTGKGIFAVEHHPAEDAALADYMAEERRAKADAPLPLVLNIVSPNHGTARAYSPKGVTIVWAPYPNICELVEAALLRDFDGERVRVIMTSVGVMKELTAYFLSKKTDFSRFAVSDIGTTASLLTQRWRRHLGKVWGAHVHDVYSLSEFDAPALECASCGYSHFGAPPLVAETVDPLSKQPVSEGLAELVLTSLYPYSQRQPLIRYATGDLVEIGPPCRELGFRYAGRVGEAVLRTSSRGTTEALLLPVQLEHLVDELAEAARHRTIFEQVTGIAMGVGQAKFRAAPQADGSVLVEVGVTFAPELFTEHARDLEARIERALLERHPNLAAARLRVRCVGGEAVGPWFVKGGV